MNFATAAVITTLVSRTWSSRLRVAVPALLVALAICGGVVLRAAHAQETNPPPAAAPPPSGVVDFDVSLARKAFAIFRAPSLQVESEFRMDVKAPGLSFRTREQIAAVAKRAGKKFRSTVTMLPADGTAGSGSGPRFVVVGDGKQVFTHRPGLRQYAVAPRRAWDAGDDDLTVLGLLASTYLDGFLSDLASAFDAGGADSKMVLDAFKQSGASLTGKPETVDGVDRYVFTLDVSAGGNPTTYRLFIDPMTGALAQLELRTREKGLDLTMTEKVSRLSNSPNAVATPGTFTFAPPAGTKKVKKLAVEPMP